MAFINDSAPNNQAAIIQINYGPLDWCLYVWISWDRLQMWHLDNKYKTSLKHYTFDILGHMEYYRLT